MVESQSFIETSQVLEADSNSFQQNFRKQLWGYKREISDLTIKLEAEKKKNLRLEQSYVNLPVNIEEMEAMKAELEIAKSRTSQLEKKLKDTEELVVKYKKDLEGLREYMFKEIKDKEFEVIERDNTIRNGQAEYILLKNQYTLLYEQYDQMLKKPNSYKQKYRKLKEELKQSKEKKPRKGSMSKIEADFLNLKLELASAQRKIFDITKSRDELAKKYNDLEFKNQRLAIAKSEIKSTMHKQGKTLTEMELDFQDILKGIESEKNEEMNDLLDKVAHYEKVIKDIKHGHENAIAVKVDEIENFKFTIEEMKRQYIKLEKDKHKVESELNEAKLIIDDHDNEILSKEMEFEAKLEALRRENTEKVYKYKHQIQDLEQRTKELQEAADIARKSVLVGESLFDELNELTPDFRESRLGLKAFQGSVFKQFEENDQKFEKLNEKIQSLKAKKKDLSNEVNAKIESLNECEKKIKKLEHSIKNLEEELNLRNDSINDYECRLKNLENDRINKEKEASRLKDQNQELSFLLKEKSTALDRAESEMAKTKASLEENVYQLKQKYNDKIVRYKENILDLTESCKSLRDNLDQSKSTTNQFKSEEIEASKKLLQKNGKLKGKVESLMKCLKNKAEAMSKLQAKLREFYTIPKVDENLEEDAKEPCSADKEDLENVIEKLKVELQKIKDKSEDLEKRNQILTKLVQTNREILIIRENKRDEPVDTLVLSPSKGSFAPELPQKQKTFTFSQSGQKIESSPKNKPSSGFSEASTLELHSLQKSHTMGFSIESLASPRERPSLGHSKNRPSLGIVQTSVKVDALKDQIRSIAQELDFSTEIIQSCSLVPSTVLPKSEEKRGELSLNISSPFSLTSPRHASTLTISPQATEIYLIKDSSSEESEVLKLKISYEQLLLNMRQDYESQLTTLEQELEKFHDSSLKLGSEKDQDKINTLQAQVKELEITNNSLEKELKFRNDRSKKIEKELNDSLMKSRKLESELSEIQSKLQEVEEQLRRLEEERANEEIRVTTEIDYSDSDDENKSLGSRRFVAVSVIENFEEVITEGSVLEEEEPILRNPFEDFKKSLLFLKPVASPESNKIKELEVAVSDKISQIRRLEETIKDLDHQITMLQDENAHFKEQIIHSEQRFHEVSLQSKTRQTSKDFSHEYMLQEAKMTLLQAHNQRLETELIVSKTNWGEFINSLSADNQRLEKELNEARADIKMLRDEKDELVKRINEEANKGKGFFGMFKRKKRNSNIM